MLVVQTIRIQQANDRVSLSIEVNGNITAVVEYLERVLPALRKLAAAIEPESPA